MVATGELLACGACVREGFLEGAHNSLSPHRLRRTRTAAHADYIWQVPERLPCCSTRHFWNLAPRGTRGTRISCEP